MESYRLCTAWWLVRVISGRLIRLSGDDLTKLPQAPFDKGPRALFVAFFASAEFGCFLELGWALPTNTLDLYVEFRRLRCGTGVSKRGGLVAALDHFNLSQHAPSGKQEWRDLAMRGGPYTSAEEQGLLDYCQEDVDGTCQLFWKMECDIEIPHALIRGRYMQSVAKIERNGVPIDIAILNELIDQSDTIKLELISKADVNGVYTDGSFSERRFEKLLALNQIPWPRLKSGRLQLTDEAFRQQAKVYPKIIAPYHELRAALSQLKLSSIAVGQDGRNCMLSPFGSDTGRNQPSTSKFIFGPSVWLRGLIKKPPKGRFIAYIDWAQQELGIAAALSGTVICRRHICRGSLP